MSQIDFDKIIDKIQSEASMGPYEYLGIIECKRAMREACIQVLNEASKRGAEKAHDLFAELASTNGRLITPKLVESEMNQSILQIKEEL